MVLGDAAREALDIVIDASIPPERHIQTGKPDQNAYVERFHRTYHREVLDAQLFESLSQVCRVMPRCLRESNDERSHDSLEDQMSSEYRQGSRPPLFRRCETVAPLHPRLC